MKSSARPGTLPLDYAAEIAFELHLLRGECCQAARDLMRQRQLDENALEECARLDEALARAHAVVHAALARIKGTRAKRRPRSK